MTRAEAERLVRHHFPGARVRWASFVGCWIVSQYRRKGQKALSGLQFTEDKAWIAAAGALSLTRK